MMLRKVSVALKNMIMVLKLQLLSKGPKIGTKSI